MIHVKERVRDLTVNISLAVRVTGLIQSETDGGIRDNYDLQGHFGVAW